MAITPFPYVQLMLSVAIPSPVASGSASAAPRLGSANGRSHPTASRQSTRRPPDPLPQSNRVSIARTPWHGRE